MEYHWYHRAESAPPVLVHPEELSVAETQRICVACTQTSLSAAKQKSLVNSWCQLLPTLSHVKTLWLSSKVPQALFDAACQMTQLEDLWVKWSGITSLAAIQSLTNLQYFHLGSSTGLESIEPLAQMVRLKWLGLENLKRIRTIEPIGALTQLEGLTLEGSMWNVWKVHTLIPLRSLTNLRYLSLAALRSDDRTLAPLFGLGALETFNVPKWWDHEEVQEIRRRNPRLAV